MCNVCECVYNVGEYVCVMYVSVCVCVWCMGACMCVVSVSVETRAGYLALLFSALLP